MKKTILKAAVVLLAATAISEMSASAQIGKPYIHDPSTIMLCDGKYYTFGTGGGGLISEDGWAWYSGAVRPGGGAAPDAIKIGDRYLIAYYFNYDRMRGDRHIAGTIVEIPKRK